MSSHKSIHQTATPIISMVVVAVFALVLLWAISYATRGQAAGTTLMEQTAAERLGYPSDAKLLMVHADDLGMARSINAASTKAFESGLVTSGSIMVPCPWFPEIAQYARAHPQADLGLHLALTSEWNFYRWGPVTSKDKVPGLLDKQGYLFATAEEVASHATTSEIEIELRAQIDRAREFGIEPTHLDSHMRTLYENPAFLRSFIKVAHEKRLPLMLVKDLFSQPGFSPDMVKPNEILVDRIETAGPDVSIERWDQFYINIIKNLQPGVTELIIHLAYDDEEMRAATVDHKDWGAAWRQRDFNFFTSEGFRRLLDDNKIKLVTYRELAKRAKIPQ
jgi:predicted glycoside hydrolase/deacetylase ChbG (UPF0249 family)